MTKRQAVLKAYVLWAWLEHTGYEKKRYPVEELLANYFYFTCPLCEYAGHYIGSISHDGCILNCPMKYRWPSHYYPHYKHMVCNQHGTAYMLWADGFKKKLNAGRIAAALWKLYKELEEV